MSLETESAIRRRSREAGEADPETREAREGEADKELQRAAALERADLLVKEVKQSQRQMRNILWHMTEVTKAIQALRAQLRLASTSDDPASVKQDKQRIEALKRKIADYQAELSKMRGDLIREQMEELKRGVGVGLSASELHRRAEELVDNMIKGRGFSLIEVMLGVAVFLIFAVGIYSGIQLVFRVVYQSRLRILETAILNEQVEVVRNLPYQNVGLVSGSPAGVLTRTVTITRNGIEFAVTRTVRNIDDPYDGTIGGNPNDLSPADYKLAEIEIVCSRCGQREPVRLSTRVGPKYLEGDPTHGALFIQVFDAAAQPVPGATVRVVSTATNPPLDLTDTTGNDGRLRLVDLPSGIGVYAITVSKVGYTMEQTTAPSETVPNPTTPPASVVTQDVTEISFAIDRVSSLNLNSLNRSCQPVGGVSVNVLGTKLIGTEPNVFKVNRNVATDGSGSYTIANLEWDAYGLRPSDYDLIGSLPSLPITLAPGMNQPVQLILGANTSNSLIVNVRDSVSGQPLSNASVRLTASGVDQRKNTGEGSTRQTDWSGGDGQEIFTDETDYFDDDGKVDVIGSAGDIRLRRSGNHYMAAGELESSTFDFGSGVTYLTLNWEPLSQSAPTGSDAVRWQIATSPSSSPASWNYKGPDGTASAYYTASNFNIHGSHNGQRYFRYKLFLRTADNDYTPTVSDISVAHTTSCTPPGQAYFGGLLNQEYTVEISRSGFQTRTETLTVSEDMILAVDLLGN